MEKIKKGDKVKILLGKDRGKEEKVEKVYGKKGKILILGANLYKRHVKKQGTIEGGIIDIPKPFTVSNVALVCPNCKKVTRIGYTMAGKDKVRICRKCRKEIDKNAKA